MNFMKQQGTREERAQKALGEMGASVLVGITFTKFIGVVVLASRRVAGITLAVDRNPVALCHL